jgi:hypothetical protein
MSEYAVLDHVALEREYEESAALLRAATQDFGA